MVMNQEIAVNSIPKEFLNLPPLIDKIIFILAQVKKIQHRFYKLKFMYCTLCPDIKEKFQISGFFQVILVNKMSRIGNHLIAAMT